MKSAPNSANHRNPAIKPRLSAQNQPVVAAVQLTVTGFLFETMRYQRLTKRELLKTTRLAWAAIGQPLPRGAILPPWSQAGPRIEHMMRVLQDVLGQMRAGTLTSERDIAERLSVMLRW